MPLFPCPDCGNQVSTRAEFCPRCGRPVDSIEIPPELIYEKHPYEVRLLDGWGQKPKESDGPFDRETAFSESRRRNAELHGEPETKEWPRWVFAKAELHTPYEENEEEGGRLPGPASAHEEEE